MNVDRFMFTARSIEDESTDYRSMESYHIKSTSTLVEGTGQAESPYQVRIKIENQSSIPFKGVLKVEMHCEQQSPRFLLPAFMYGRNRGEYPQTVPDQYPRIREEMNQPSSPWWMVRSDRLSHPAAFVYTDDRVVGFHGSPYFVKGDKRIPWKPGVRGEFDQYTGFTCSLHKGAVGYTLGYENAPWFFSEAHDVRERAPLGENCFRLAAGEIIEFDLHVFDYEVSSPLGLNLAMEQVYDYYHESPRIASDSKTTVMDMANAIADAAWLEEDKSYAGMIFITEDGYHFNKIISLSWTNGLSVAVPMLMSAHRIGNESMRQQALTCIEHIIGSSLNPATGLPFEAYHDGTWSNRGWWYDRMHTGGHSSYLIGQALYYIMKAYVFEQRFANVVHEDWMILVESILEKLEKTKNSDHEYPFILSAKTGAGLEYDSFGSIWCMTALAYYSYIKQDHSRLESLIQSENHYYESFVKRMECYGTPLDTSKATDSEGILAYLKGVRYLHLLTKNPMYLERMRDGFHYEFTFKFCYNSPIKTPPLSNLGWSSCGGSVTSVANPHIHPMSSNVIDELLYYSKESKDVYATSRLVDTVLWSCQCYNRFDKEFDYGKKGWMSERFCHSEGLLKQKYEDGSPASTWFCLMPWASGSILDGLAGDYWDQD